MGESTHKKFDCVRTMRQIREEISAEIAGMTYDELTAWLQAKHEDPTLERIANGPAQPGVAAEPSGTYRSGSRP